MVSLDLLNRITNIIINRERILIPASDLEQAIFLQEELSDQMAIEQSEFTVASLVILQVFYYLMGNSSDVLAAEFSAPAIRKEICDKAMQILTAYTCLFPPQHLLISMSASRDSINLQQRALDGDHAAQVQVAELLTRVGNDEAALYWVSAASVNIGTDWEPEQLQSQLQSQLQLKEMLPAEAPLGVTDDSVKEPGATIIQNVAQTTEYTALGIDKATNQPSLVELHVLEIDPEKVESVTEYVLQETEIDSSSDGSSLCQKQENPRRFGMTEGMIRSHEIKAEWDEAYRLMKSELETSQSVAEGETRVPDQYEEHVELYEAVVGIEMQVVQQQHEPEETPEYEEEHVELEITATRIFDLVVDRTEEGQAHIGRFEATMCNEEIVTLDHHHPSAQEPVTSSEGPDDSEELVKEAKIHLSNADINAIYEYQEQVALQASDDDLIQFLDLETPPSQQPKQRGLNGSTVSAKLIRQIKINAEIQEDARLKLAADAAVSVNSKDEKSTLERDLLQSCVGQSEAVPSDKVHGHVDADSELHGEPEAKQETTGNQPGPEILPVPKSAHPRQDSMEIIQEKKPQASVVETKLAVSKKNQSKGFRFCCF